MTTTANRRRKATTRRLPIVPIVLGLIALLGVVAVVASRGGDGDRAADGIEETRAVAIEGEPVGRHAGGPDPAIGSTAPEVRGADFDGTPVRIVDDGRPKVLVFLAHWCPHCQVEVPVLVDWLADNGTPADVDIYGISTSTTPDRPNYPPSEWLERERFTVPVLVDDEESTSAAVFGLSSFPYFVALDEAHRVVARGSGELSVAQWEALLDEARAAADTAR